MSNNCLKNKIFINLRRDRMKDLINNYKSLVENIQIISLR